MDFVKSFTGDNNKVGEQKPNEEQKSSGGGFMDKLNGMAGGGQQGEKNEDGLDKGKFTSSLLPVVTLQLT